MADERIILLPHVQIDMGRGFEEALNGIIASLNLQTGVDGKAKAPFIKPRSIANRKSVRRLTVYGTSGCGKTRCLFELIKLSSRPSSRIYVINPKGGLSENSIKRTYLADIISQCNQDDIIVWDNFPEGLEKMNPANAKLAVKMLCSYGKHGTLIALSPEYVEREGTEALEDLGMNAVHLEFSQADIRRILASTGRQVLSREGFGMIVANLSEIALLLWQVEPTPKVVLDYLGQLAAKDLRKIEPEYPLILARQFSSRPEHYKNQFKILSETSGRKDDVEFLYTVKVCYELGLDRKIGSVLSLQRGIFGSRPDEDKILQRLRLWLQQSVRNQVMLHDIVRQAILLRENTIRKVMSFLASHFDETIPFNDQNAYLFGSFVGRNCHIASKTDLLTLLPKKVKMGEKDIRGHRFYQVGLGHGIGRMTANLGSDMIGRIFAAADTNGQFGRNLGEGIGWEVMKLHTPTYEKAFDYARRNLMFSRGIGIGIGMTFPHLSSQIKKDIFTQAESNVQFADGLGIGIGAIIEFIPTDIHPWLFRTAESNSEFARGLGTGLGHSLAMLAEKIQLYALSFIKENSQFARGLGTGLGDVYVYLPKQLQKEAIHIAKTNSEFSVGFGIGIGYSFSYLSPKLQNSMLHIAEGNPAFAYGAGVGIGFTYHYLDHEVQSKALKNTKRNVKFAVGLGEGYGLTYTTLPKHLQQEVLLRVKENVNVAVGFGMGTGYGFDYFSKRLQEAFMELTSRNEEFAEGFGFGLGRVFNLHRDQLKNTILSDMLAEENGALAFGIGHGLGFAFEYLSEEVREKVFMLARQNSKFAAGLGKGIGTTFNYYSEGIQEQIIAESLQNLGLKMSIRDGAAGVWRYLDKGDRQLAGMFG